MRVYDFTGSRRNETNREREKSDVYKRIYAREYVVYNIVRYFVFIHSCSRHGLLGPVRAGARAISVKSSDSRRSAAAGVCAR